MADPIETETYTAEQYQALLAEKEALKANRDEALTEAKKAKAALKGYDGVDAEEFRKLKAASEEAERRAAEAKGDFESLKKQLTDKHEVELKGRDDRISKMQRALERRLIDGRLAESLAKHEADPSMLELLKLKGREFVRMKETDADFEEYVADEHGNPLVADGKGTPMTVDDLVTQTLKVKYPGAFRGTGSSGGGAIKSTAGSGGSQKTIVAGDSNAWNANLAEIAKGNVKVVSG